MGKNNKSKIIFKEIIQMQKTLKLIGKICVITVASILALVILFLGGLNIAKFAIYSEYYSIKTNICKNPGLSDGFVCQGICAYEEENKFFVSGYMKDGSASRIYVTDDKNESYYVSLSLNGKAVDAHAGGIATHGDKVYVVDHNCVYVIPLEDILGAKDGDIVEIKETVKTDNAGSAAYTDGKYLYVGEFHDGVNYITDHPYNTPDGTYYAIISCYSFDDMSKPEKVYSIRNKVQGMCFTPDGKVVLSTSYGLADSYYYVYDESKAIDSGLTHEGAPVYYLCETEKVVKGPAMAEGLDYYNGMVITLTESASDKYIFGKFFFADKIVGLEF